MKQVVLLLIGALLLIQIPLAWDAFNKAQQCQQSAAKQASSKLGALLPDLDLIDCSLMRYYRNELRNLISE